VNTVSRLATSADLPTWAIVVAVALAACNLALLLIELRRRERGGAGILFTGVLAIVALVLAVLRPVRVAAKENIVGPRVVVLADTSRSMALADGAAGSGAGTRAAARDRAIAAINVRASDARLVVLGFGDGAPTPFDVGGGHSDRAVRSDLASAIQALAASPDERPRAVIVVSDGRLDNPTADASPAALRALGRTLGVPVHAIATTRDAPADASIRKVAAAGVAVAHVAFPLHIEVGCAGGLPCDELKVTAKELREDGPPSLLASGTVHVKDGKGAVDLMVTLERAGSRILDVSLVSPPGDTIPENDRRLVTFDVARERVRVLHVAGRPTDDVRALREWLKSDASVDVVAFFILRTPTDNPHADQQDLALIPFPVDELFSEDLPTFDAVVLQDFDAQPYGLEKHLPALARYVRGGGGLIMVGGPNSFIGGGYADTPLGNAVGVLPVALDSSPNATASDPVSFEPSWTEQGRAAPLLAPLRAIVGDELPAMPGTNVLGDARPGTVVLWSHPSRTTPNGKPMPVLAVGEAGDGRTIALGLDGAWRLEFSPLGARTAGRGYGALWSGLLGWLMRDPRFEPAQVEVVGGCTAGLPVTLRVHTLPEVAHSPSRSLSVDVAPLEKESAASGKSSPVHREVVADAAGTTELSLPPLAAGGYVARLHVGASGTTRRDFACEAGGDEWADSRPDGARLRELAEASGGAFAWASDGVSGIPLPSPTTVSAERHVAPVAPPWVWTVSAAILLGAHWIARRRGGLA
jgi:uncharacterized membrane protein